MREITIDLFAGGGGASTGIEQALGGPVTLAINHDPEAIRMHWLNHPKTWHITEDIWRVDPLKATKGYPVGLLWASPDCTHHSRAKGGKPRSNKRRSLADVIIEWARIVKPRVIVLENVIEFEEWGPLDECGMPIKALRGMDFQRWVNAIREQGYAVEWRRLIACDHGAPTTRRRLFMIARCDEQPIIWPDPTHGEPGLFGLKPYRTAAECIDWTIPCPSIFERKKPLAENTLRRIARGIQKFVINTGDPFVIKFRTGATGSSIFEPMHTITAGSYIKRPAGAGHAMGLVTPSLIKYHGQKANETRGQRLDESLRTLDTSNRFALVSTFLTKFYGTNIGSDMRQPVPTVTATGQHPGMARQTSERDDPSARCIRCTRSNRR